MFVIRYSVFPNKPFQPSLVFAGAYPSVLLSRIGFWPDPQIKVGNCNKFYFTIELKFECEFEFT
jgi:hypothetical protein